MRDFSYSNTLGEFSCLKAAEFYINRQETPPSEALDEGVSFHKAVEEFLLHGTKDDRIYGKFRDLLTSLNFDPQDVEITLEHTTEDGFKLKGIFDLFDSSNVIYDWKHPFKPWDDFKFKKYASGQGVLYPWLAKQCGRNVQAAKFVVVPRSGGMQIFEIELDWDKIEREIQKHKMRYKMLLNAARNDLFPALPSMQRCKWCNYKTMCEEAWG